MVGTAKRVSSEVCGSGYLHEPFPKPHSCHIRLERKPVSELPRFVSVVQYFCIEDPPWHSVWVSFSVPMVLRALPQVSPPLVVARISGQLWLDSVFSSVVVRVVAAGTALRNSGRP